MTELRFQRIVSPVSDEAGKFPGKLKALRRNLDCSQAEFSKAVGVNLRTLQNWEIARVIPEYHELILIGLQQRVDALLEKGQPKKPRKRRRQT